MTRPDVPPAPPAPRAATAAARLADGVHRPAPAVITVDGREVVAYPGESLASALLAAGYRAVRTTASGAARGPYCNMGVCFECVVEVDGVPATRSCLVAVRPGMRVTTGLTPPPRAPGGAP